MKTLVAVISIGSRHFWTRHSLPRIERWSRLHRLDLVVVRQPLIAAGINPHFNKLAVPARFPGYDRYVIVDDDLLIARHAPAPPEVAAGQIGLVPDPEQRLTTATYVDFTGNTGFVVADAAAAPVFADALARGRDPAIWGFNDQSALNRSGWERKCVVALDARWNHLPVVSHIVSREAWDSWKSSSLHRLRFYFGLLPGAPTAARRLLRGAHGVHLIRAPHPAFYSRLVD